MIVGFFPGGTIKNARVVLKPDETLPNRYNVLESEVLRMDPETYQEILIKPIGTILPADSEILSHPEITIDSILNLTIDTKTGDNNPYEHQDIIRMDEAGEDSGDNGGVHTDLPDPLVP